MIDVSDARSPHLYLLNALWMEYASNAKVVIGGERAEPVCP